MKLSTYLILLSPLLFSVNAAAIPIATVGIYDEVYASVKQGSADLPNSSSANEKAWIEKMIGYDVFYKQNDGTSSGTYWEQVTGTGSAAGDYAFDLGAGEADYYLIKTGVGSGAGAEYTHHLFKNKNSMQWAFINLSVFGPDVSLTNFDIISHVGITVPEPGVFGLLAIGLLGFAATSRKKTV